MNPILRGAHNQFFNVNTVSWTPTKPELPEHNIEY